MAVKSSKQVTQSIAENLITSDIPAPEINLEEEIADQLLDNIDWQKVKAAMLSKARAKFWQWLTNGNNTPVNISAFPELSALPSSEGEAA